NRGHGGVVPVIGEHTAAVVDTNPDTRTPGEDVPPGAEYFPCRCRIRVRPARIVDTSVEASPEQRPRPITRSHPTARWTPPLAARNVRLDTASVTNVVLTPNPLDKRINRGGHRAASELAKRAPLLNRGRDKFPDRGQQQVGSLRQPATHPPGNCRSSRLHAFPRT